MNIQQTSREPFDQAIRDNPHPAGHHHNLHRSGLKTAQKLTIQCFTILMHTMIEDIDIDSKPFRPLLGPTARVVDDKQAYVRIQITTEDRLSESLEVRSTAGGHHSDAQGSLLSFFSLARFICSGARFMSHLPILPIVRTDLLQSSEVVFEVVL